jgi:hypothetical protein
MEWETQYPLMAGWYWFQVPGKRPEVVEVFHTGTAWYCMYAREATPLHNLHGQWAGPLPLPRGQLL